jgi:hypothetical protein
MVQTAPAFTSGRGSHQSVGHGGLWTQTTCTAIALSPSRCVQPRDAAVLPQTPGSLSYIIARTVSTTNNGSRAYAASDRFQIEIEERHRCLYSDHARQNITITPRRDFTSGGIQPKIVDSRR